MSKRDTLLMASNLTQSQLLIWTGQKLSPGAPLYNMVLTFDIHGLIDVSRFRSAFQQLINQSDALRTIFTEKGGIPQQKVLPELIYTLEVLDWSEASKSPEDQVSWLDTRNRQQFDLSKPLFDSVLIKKSEDHWVWYLNQHHLITDAWAVSVLYRRMADLYRCLGKGRVNKVIPIPAFENYLTYEKEVRLHSQNEKAKSYWEQTTAKLPPSPRLYGYTGSPATTKAVRVSLDLGVERSHLLRELTMEKDLRSWTRDLSLFNIFTAVLFAYLYRVSAQTRLAIGTPTHNRTTADFKETPGLFIEVLPMIADIDPEDTFSTLLQRVRTQVAEFLMNAQPGTAVPELGQGFNVVLNYIHATFPGFDGMPVKSEWLHPGHVDPRHHLRLQVHDFEGQGSIQLHFDLNQDVFEPSLQEKVPKHFLRMLDAFISDRFQPVSKVTLTDAEEHGKIIDILHQQLVVESSDSTVVDLFQQQAPQNSPAIALSYQGQSMSYGELNEKSNQLARHLTEKGISKGERVIIYLPRTPEFVIGMWGILKAGCIFVPVAADNPYQRIRHIVDSARPAMVLTNDALAGAIKESGIALLRLDSDWPAINKETIANPDVAVKPESPAYIMYTSGSTGDPKGVVVSHRALAHYSQWAGEKYSKDYTPVFPFFTAVGFDLTITSLFVPLTSGGSIRIYEESGNGPDLSLLQVIEDNAVNIIKLTPAHLSLLRGKDLKASAIKTMIVGGEDLKAELAKSVAGSLGKGLRLFNEYGPTEATVGCVIHEFKVNKDRHGSVPIGKPAPKMLVYVLDANENPVPQGVSGELYIAGRGLADGYWDDTALTKKRFIDNKFVNGTRMYRTGDMVRLNQDGELEFSGRIDAQIKIGGIRVEPGEIEAALSAHPEILDCVVELQSHSGAVTDDGDISYCVRCGLPSNYPNVSFDESGTCELCLSFDTYSQKAGKYFKTPDELNALLTDGDSQKSGAYDCMMLLSGGKDSTYALAQLVEMGAKVLAYTLDNGYISEEAKANINRVAAHLGVDHMYGTTPAMNAIFVDSLKRHSNVCNGCFKTLYTLSTKVALEKKIPFIVTGLSRGQFFETRLTEELFWKDDVDIKGIDDIILNARKAYHRVNDGVNKLLDTSMFADDKVFEQVRFIDFYRFNNVSMDDMMQYLEQHLPWIRPKDTGRSTNCLINQLGIYVHKKQQGYSNYAFPYSWDVRLGHKTRQGALDEINEGIDTSEVHRMMREIGYTETQRPQSDEKHLVAFYTASSSISHAGLRAHLARYVPGYMIPSYFRHLESLPLTSNGKVDRQALPGLNIEKPVMDVPYVAPGTEVEMMLMDIWTEVLQMDRIGIHDNFLDLGGNSLAAIRIAARIEDSFKLELPVNNIFDKPTIATLAASIESTILAMLEAHKAAQ